MRKYLTANKVWPFTYYFLFFAAIAAFSPILVLYFQQLGFSGAQIGLLTGIPPLITLVTVPLWTRTADRANRHRLIMSLSLLVSALGCLALPWVASFPAVFAVTAVFMFFLGPSLSLANSASMFMLGEEQDQFGAVRVGGTIGYGVATFLAGALIERFGMSAGFVFGAVLFIATFLSSLWLVYDQEGEQEGIETGRISDVLHRPNWLLFLLLAFIGGVAMAAFNNYFYPYMAELGASSTITGLALTLGNVAELPVMLLSNRFIGAFGGFGTMVLSTAVTGLRLVLLGLAGGPAGAIASQALNGLTTPLFLIAGTYYADRHALSGLRSTSQGLFNSAMLGFGSAVGGFISGILLTHIGGGPLFTFIGALTLLVLAVVMLVQRRLHARTGESLG